jgi:hypothetical protein
MLSGQPGKSSSPIITEKRCMRSALTIREFWETSDQRLELIATDSGRVMVQQVDNLTSSNRREGFPPALSTALPLGYHSRVCGNGWRFEWA